MSTLFQYTDLENQWVGGITKFLGFTGGSCMRTQLELKWQSYDRVGRVVHGVVFSLNQLLELNSVELVVSSLTERYTSEI